MVKSRPLDSDKHPSTYELCDLGQVANPLWACFVCKMGIITTWWSFCKEQEDHVCNDHVKMIMYCWQSVWHSIEVSYTHPYSYCYCEYCSGISEKLPAVRVFIYSGREMQHRVKKFQIHRKRASFPRLLPTGKRRLHGSPS